jgi:hypothetical protein
LNDQMTMKAMATRRMRFVPVAIAVAIASPSAQQPPDGSDGSGLRASIERLKPVLDALEDYQARMPTVEAIRAQNGAACTADPASQSLGDALLWSMDAQRQSAADFARGTAALDACRLSIADDALDSLTQQNAQVADMVQVFAGLGVADAPPFPALDRILEQAKWIAALKADAPDLADLARRLEAAAAAGAVDAGSFQTTAARANRLVELSRRADEALRQALTCVVAPQPLSVVGRIVSIVKPIQAEARELAAVIKQSKDGAASCVQNASAAVAKTPSGPSWLPPPAGAATVRKAPAALPSWVPDKDTPATQTATTRSADAVGENRDKLIAEEAQRIEEQVNRTTDTRAQRAADAQRAQDTQAAQAMQAQHERALAQAQQQVVQAQQQRAQRRTSFLGLLGRVTAAVGVIAATGGLAAPALAAILPAVGAVSAVAGGGAGMLNMAAALPMPASVAQAVAVARVASPLTGAPVAPAGTVATKTDPFIGGWDCTIASNEIGAGGKQTSRSDQTKLYISGGSGNYTMPTQYGALTGQAAAGQVVFSTAVPQGAGASCAVDIRLQPSRGDAMTGTSNVTCPRGEQMRGTFQCRSHAQ